MELKPGGPKIRARQLPGRREPRIIDRVGSNPDVVVVGAGIIGCAIGRELARRGARVRIFETRSIGAGATQASAGVLAPYIEGHDRGALFDLTLRSLGLYDRFVAEVLDETGIDVEYRRCGTLEIATDMASGDRLRDAAKQNDDRSVLEWLDAKAARAMEPSLAGSIQGALWASVHGYVAVPQLTEALAWAALRYGAQIETT